MALRWIESCGPYGTDGVAITRRWTLAQATPLTTSGRRGGPCFSFVAGQGVAKTLTHQNNYIQGCAASITEVGNLSGVILAFANDNTNVLTLTINADATLSMNCGNKSIVSTLAVADPTSWHYYELAGTFGSASGTLVGTGTVMVDGKQFITGTITSNILLSNLIDGSATANQVGIGFSQSAGMLWQDYYCLDTGTTDFYNGGTLASTNTTFLNDVEIDALYPATDITTGWGSVGGDGTHAYSCVNGVPPTYDSDYVYTTGAATEAFEYQPITGFSGVILGAQYSVLCRKDAEGTRLIKTLVHGSGVESIEFLSSTNYLSDFYVYYVCPLDSDLGTAWTTAVYNTETFGVAFVA